MTDSTIELIRKPAVQKATGLSSAQIYLLMRQKRFPGVVKLGRASAWVLQEVNEWVQERVNARGTQPR